MLDASAMLGSIYPLIHRINNNAVPNAYTDFDFQGFYGEDLECDARFLWDAQNRDEVSRQYVKLGPMLEG